METRVSQAGSRQETRKQEEQAAQGPGLTHILLHCGLEGAAAAGVWRTGVRHGATFEQDGGLINQANAILGFALDQAGKVGCFSM